METSFHSVAEALADLADGRVIIVVDDENRENEGDLIGAAQFATPAMINFMATHARGLICLAMQGDRLDALKIPLMVSDNTDNNQTAFTVSIDAGDKWGVSTGISAGDRARTIQAILHPDTRADDLRRPGHIFPLRSREGGVLKRAGHTEAAVDLAQLAGLYPAGVICEIQNDDGTMARLPELRAYAKTFDLKIITIADLIAYRLQHERFVQRESVAAMPSEFGQFQVYGYRDSLNHAEHVAIVKGNPNTFRNSDVLVRVHSECLTGDAFGSVRCDCRRQLQSALKMIEYHGQGVVVYLRQEGRGIGLLNKIKAYALQDIGLDTVEANERLGFDADLRNYGVGAQILTDLGIERMRLITNNPRKIAGLGGFGLEVVERVPLIIEMDDTSARYLATKAEKLGHLLLQARLLTVALSGNWTNDTDYLNQIQAIAPYVIQPDLRPLTTAIFGDRRTVLHIGLEQRPAHPLDWYAATPANPEAQIHREQLLHLLSKLQHLPQLRSLAWIVASGNDDPLDRRAANYPHQPSSPDTEWQGEPGVIYECEALSL